MKLTGKRILCCIAIIVICLNLLPGASAANFVPNPKTDYAVQFVAQCDGQQWFLNEIERQLNLEEKTVDLAHGPGDFANIISLGFTGKGVGGKLPRALGELRNLKHLFLSGNKLTGPIIPELLTLSKLEDLDLSQNDMSGTIPVGLGSLHNLTTLLLWNNGFTGGAPKELAGLARLVNLDLSQNYLTGTIPTEYGSFASIRMLALNRNSLSGVIPTSLGQLSALKGLSLWGNYLTGGIPAELGNLKKLEILDLAKNPNLGGNLPDALSGCIELKRLAASECKLVGSIPDAWQSLTKLQTMDLSQNVLRGTIPTYIGTLPALTHLHLQNNNLVGYAPAGLSTKEMADGVIQLEHNYLTGAELLKLKNNVDNFCDGATTTQNRLFMPKTVQVNKNAVGNLYNSLTTINPQTTALSGKALLRPTEYSCTVIQGDASQLIITIDDTGIFVKPLADIPLASPYILEIRILHNDGSAYSATRVELVTEVSSSGGNGGTGGGVVVVDPGKTPLARQESHMAYVKGYPDKTFRPDSRATREEFVAIMVRIREKTLITSGRSFPDVPDGLWSADYIRTAKDAGWITGYADGHFGPKDFITRGEAAAMLYRIFEPADAKEKTFSDISGHWAEKYIRAVAESGNLSGYSDGTFKPDNTITRAELVRMVNVMLHRNANANAVAKYKQNMKFTDMPESHWAYAEVLEASLEHEAEYNGSTEGWLKLG